MTISPLHFGITILIAILLHGSLALWLSMPEPIPLEQKKQTLKISLLATIAETATNVASKLTPPEKKPEPKIKPLPKKPQPPVKPIPEVKKVAPAVEKIPEPVTEATPPPEKSVPVAADPIATARYEQLLVAWLEKHKKYPRRAKRLRIEGEGMLRILINRSGQTQQVSLEQRTGNRLLDKAALAMAKRANPFPPIPQNDPRSQLEFVVPVAFVLR